MGTDSKLYNLRTKEKIDCDRYYNLHNVLSYKYNLDDKLSGDGASRDELIELCDDLVTLSMLSTEMLQQIMDNLKTHSENDKFILIDDNDERY
jgi:hypothetical protein